jgi:hypothetical protein
MDLNADIGPITTTGLFATPHDVPQRGGLLHDLRNRVKRLKHVSDKTAAGVYSPYETPHGTSAATI